LTPVLFTAFIAFVVSRQNYGVRFFIGMAIAAFGIVLWAVARVQLGSSFAVTAQAKKLVTTGLYWRIRNPIYFFGGIGYLGLFIAWGNWIALAAFPLFFSDRIPRVRKEQQVLEQALAKNIAATRQVPGFEKGGPRFTLRLLLRAAPRRARRA
jgi:protein-S-isoprenylcysteine O-methyltransferase Ste14